MCAEEAAFDHSALGALVWETTTASQRSICRRRVVSVVFNNVATFQPAFHIPSLILQLPQFYGGCMGQGEMQDVRETLVSHSSLFGV